MRRQKEEFSLEEKNITIEVHGKTLNGFASVCPRVSFERTFDNEVLLEYLSYILCPKSPIYRSLMTIQKSLEQM